MDTKCWSILTNHRQDRTLALHRGGKPQAIENDKQVPHSGMAVSALIETLRLRPLWLAIGWGLVMLVIYLSLTPQPPRLDADYGDKVGHLLAYGVLMGWFSQLYSNRRRPLALALFALGVVLELIQGMIGYREASLADAAANGLGVIAGWAVTARLPNLFAS